MFGLGRRLLFQVLCELWNIQFIVIAEFGWILTRHPEGISDSKQARIYSMLENYGINTNKFSKTNQSGCPGRQ